MSEIERNGTSYRTCLKCSQYKYIGSIFDIVYRFFSEKIYFYTKLLYTHSIITSYMFTLPIIALRFFTQACFPGIFGGWYYEFIERFLKVFNYIQNDNLMI